MDEFFEDVKFLTSFIGCNIFDIAKPKDEHLFYTKGVGVMQRGSIIVRALLFWKIVL